MNDREKDERFTDFFYSGITRKSSRVEVEKPVVADNTETEKLAEELAFKCPKPIRKRGRKRNKAMSRKQRLK